MDRPLLEGKRTAYKDGVWITSHQHLGWRLQCGFQHLINHIFVITRDRSVLRLTSYLQAKDLNIKNNRCKL